MEGGKFDIVPAASPVEKKPAEKKSEKKKLKRICSRCHNEYGEVESEVEGVTHGYCPDCMYIAKIDLEHNKMQTPEEVSRQTEEILKDQEASLRRCSGCGKNIGRLEQGSEPGYMGLCRNCEKKFNDEENEKEKYKLNEFRI